MTVINWRNVPEFNQIKTSAQPWLGTEKNQAQIKTGNDWLVYSTTEKELDHKLDTS